MAPLAVGIVVVGLAVAAFIVAVGIGILLGRHLDGMMQEQASRESGAGEESGSHD